MQQSEGMRDLGDVQHAAPQERDLAAVFGGEIEDLLQAMNGRTETGDHQPPLGAIEDLFEARPHGALAFGVAGPIDVGRIRHQQQHAALAVFGQVCRSNSSLSVGVGSTLKSPV